MEEQGDSRRRQPRDRAAVAMAVASWFFAALAFATLALGLLGFGFVPHFPLMAFVWLGLAAFFRILKDERAPEPATGPPTG